MNFRISVQMMAQIKVETSVHLKLMIKWQNFDIFVITFLAQSWPKSPKFQKDTFSL